MLAAIDDDYYDCNRNWLRAAVSLVVVMGLTWIVGVLIVEVKALLPLAYIYTILVAFQGLWIFIIFVLLSKQVREAYTKWWRAKVNESDFLSKYFGASSNISNKTTTTPAKTTDTSGGVAQLSLARQEEFTSSMDLPVIPITPLSIIDDPTPSPTPPMLAPAATKKRGWGTIRARVQEGTLFKVVYSPSYFDSQTELTRAHSDLTAVREEDEDST